MARILFCLLSNLSTKANYFLCKSSLQTAHEPEVGFYFVYDCCEDSIESNLRGRVLTASVLSSSHVLAVTRTDEDNTER